MEKKDTRNNPGKSISDEESPYHLTQKGTVEKLTPPNSVDTSSDDEYEEDIRYKDIPYHLSNTGSIEKLMSVSELKGFDSSYVVKGYRASSSGKIKELRIPLKKIKHNLEDLNDSSIPYHWSEYGIRDKLLTSEESKEYDLKKPSHGRMNGKERANTSQEIVKKSSSQSPNLASQSNEKKLETNATESQHGEKLDNECAKEIEKTKPGQETVKRPEEKLDHERVKKNEKTKPGQETVKKSSSQSPNTASQSNEKRLQTNDTGSQQESKDGKQTLRGKIFQKPIMQAISKNLKFSLKFPGRRNKDSNNTPSNNKDEKQKHGNSSGESIDNENKQKNDNSSNESIVNERRQKSKTSVDAHG
ncbi:hypothetical protein TNIN_306961 [Trichonephila inaurata madagascariensis]|uniref:Uncharacterized protein n=1 Tax=Trichonephila inaurata madagascariensis TaxID=2747483 RepID=A0A8X6XGK8_9ARAC|nr:hypothetical protein TNIN_306961 [Trichonephila inaurata madagascariensis]